LVGLGEFPLTSATSPRITAGVSPSDPRVCSFTLDRSIYVGSALCRSAEAAQGSPLFEHLFALPGVVQVWVAGDRVTVACAEPQPWELAAKTIAKAIRAALADGRPPVVHTSPSSSDLTERVRDVLNADVNPGLAQHGGKAELVSVEDGVALIRLTGGCQGCGAAKMTLSYGIEQSLRGKIPELLGVRDVTDHAAGERPYYSGEGKSPFEQ
jgi:Fe-S cluster biogenesis protein NfuA